MSRVFVCVGVYMSMVAKIGSQSENINADLYFEVINICVFTPQFGRCFTKMLDNVISFNFLYNVFNLSLSSQVIPKTAGLTF